MTDASTNKTKPEDLLKIDKYAIFFTGSCLFSAIYGQSFFPPFVADMFYALSAMFALFCIMETIVGATVYITTKMPKIRETE